MKKNKKKVSLAEITKTLALIEKLNDDAMLEPNEIIAMRAITNTHLLPSVFTLYRLIKSGKLPARDLSAGNKPRYFVKGRDLKDFIRNRYQLTK